ncbi:MAG: hypothetical protein JXQ71_02340 [Verrucomicrobia bacterium]|nr:hypothetical protein [Verrucomicrobiota bacterium]
MSLAFLAGAAQAVLGLPPQAAARCASPAAVPVFAWTRSDIEVDESAGSVLLVVTNLGSRLAATLDYKVWPATATAGNPDADFALPPEPPLVFLDGQSASSITIPILDDAQHEATEYFMVNLVSASCGGITNTPLAIVWILDNDEATTNSLTQIVPPGPLPPLGALQVHLEPPSARGQWRFAWENHWRDGGLVVGGLPRGNYAVVFKPVSAYREPLDTILPVLAEVTNDYSFQYTNTSPPQLGSLTVTLEPPMLATNADLAQRAQWQLEGETAWRDSGASLHALPAQGYAVHFKHVPNWWEPSPHHVSVAANRDNQLVARYYVAGQAQGIEPVPLDFETDVLTSYERSLPYACAGQILSDVGWASGFVVRERVVLTAAHAVFNDVTLSFVPEVKWFFQRHAGTYEPPPLLARGWFVLSGYAAQRTAEATPGIASVASQNLDVATLFFLEPAGRGGYGGYLVSSRAPGQWLFSSTLHTLIGYPMDLVSETNRGKLHATPIQSLSFQQIQNQVFSARTLKNYPGCVGSPLCLQEDDDIFYPAAILVGGEPQVMLRAIGSNVVALINAADYASHQSQHSTGGGPYLWGSGLEFSSLAYGFLDIRFRPPELEGGGGAYRFLEDTNFTIYTANTNRFACLAKECYTLEFLPVAGYLAPVGRHVQLGAGESNVVVGCYRAWGSNHFDASGRLWAVGTSGSVYRVEHADALPPARGWTLVQRFMLTNRAHVVTNALPAAGAGFYRAVLEP